MRLMGAITSHKLLQIHFWFISYRVYPLAELFPCLDKTVDETLQHWSRTDTTEIPPPVTTIVTTHNHSVSHFSYHLSQNITFQLTSHRKLKSLITDIG